MLRLAFMSISFLFTTSVLGQEAPFSIGVIADCQYCSTPGTGVRKYSISDQKLQTCVNHLNTLDLAFVVHLGDFIDKEFESFAVVGPIYQQLMMPKYHVLGNHDFSVEDEYKKIVPKTLKLSRRYYDFGVKDWRFIVLDGNDLSFYAYPEGSKKHQRATVYYEENNITSPKWNGGLSQKQLKWLERVLKKATRKNEKVMLYCHFPIYPENVHNLWNAAEVVALLEKYPCVKAYLNGHNHEGNYGQKSGIHFLTLKGMVDTEETSYAVVKIEDNQLIIQGFGREVERVLEIPE